jgi:hypothetical protein
MVELLGVDTSLWTAGAAVAQTIIVAAAAGVAYRQVQVARLTREDQARPFVIVDFDMSEPPLIYLVIANIGKTMARRVRIHTDPLLASSLDRDDELGYIAKLPLFTEEIPTLAPGRQLRLLFDSFPQREQGKFDDVYQVKITYQGEPRRSWWRDRTSFYDEDSVLHLGIYRNVQYVQRRTLHDLYDQVKKIADAVRRWGPVTGSGILVVSREDEREDLALVRRRSRARRESSMALGEEGEGTVQWTLRRLRDRASRGPGHRIREGRPEGAVARRPAGRADPGQRPGVSHGPAGAVAPGVQVFSPAADQTGRAPPGCRGAPRRPLPLPAPGDRRTATLPPRCR